MRKVIRILQVKSKEGLILSSFNLIREIKEPYLPKDELINETM